MENKILYLILIIAFIIRLTTVYTYEETAIRISYVGFDESVYYSLALNMLSTSPFNYTLKDAQLSFQNYRIWYLDIPLFLHPPLFTWTYMIFQFLFGSTLLVGRFMNVMLSLVNIYTIYLIGRRISINVGLLSALFLSISPLHIQFSGFVLLDMLIVVLTALFILYVLKIAENNSRKNIVICGIILGLGVLTKYNVLLTLPFLGIYILNKKIRYGDGVKILLIGLGFFSFWAIWSLSVYDISILLEHWGKVAKYGNAWEVPFYAYFTFLPVVAPFTLLSYISFFLILKPDKEKNLKMGLLLVFLAFAIFYTVSPVKDMRYILPTLPPLAVLASDWLIKQRVKYKYPILFIVVIFTLFASYRIVLGTYSWYLDFWYYQNWHEYFLDPSTPIQKV